MAEKLYEKYGHLDVCELCRNCAALAPTFKLKEETLDEVIAINMKAPLFTCQAVGKYMRKNGGGSIINISSGNTRMINVAEFPTELPRALSIF